MAKNRKRNNSNTGLILGGIAAASILAFFAFRKPKDSSGSAAIAVGSNVETVTSNVVARRGPASSYEVVKTFTLPSSFVGAVRAIYTDDEGQQWALVWVTVTSQVEQKNGLIKLSDLTVSTQNNNPDGGGGNATGGGAELTALMNLGK